MQWSPSATAVRLFEAWYNFGMDKKFKIYGGYSMHQACRSLDERAIGMIGNSLHYAAGLDTPKNKTFGRPRSAKKYKRLPPGSPSPAYTASLWSKQRRSDR